MVDDPPFLQEISKLPSKLDEANNETMTGANGTTDEGGEYNMSPEEMQLDELREARIRAAQMEKTVQWWSECTANWREKWSNVKNERNKARDEIKVLKTKLEGVNQEMYKLKRERNEFSEANAKLRKDVERMEAELRRDRRAFVPPLRVVGDGGPRNETDTIHAITSKLLKSPKNEEQKAADTIFDEAPSKVLVEDKLIEAVETKEAMENKRQILDAVLSGQEAFVEDKKVTPNTCQSCDQVREELAVLKDTLETAEKSILVEKSSKESLSDTVDELTAEIERLNGSVQEEQIAKDKAINELKSLKEERPKRLPRSTSECCTSDERKLKELRAEIEKLQKDNSAEWSKREKLETEKLAATRESKKLKHQVEDLTKELEIRINEAAKTASFDKQQLQKELEDKKKELTELKASHFKLKKVYQDKKEDVLHNQTKADHHEDEIKKLRKKVDELKQKLAMTEDEVDQKENLVRKLERSLEEQTQQCHVLQVQIEHMHSRWKTMTSMARIPRRGNDSCDQSEEDQRFFESDDDL